MMTLLLAATGVLALAQQQPIQPASAKEVIGPSADSIRPYRPVGRDPFKKTVIKTAKPGAVKKPPKAIGFPSLEVRRFQFQQKVARTRQLEESEPDPLTQYLVNELDVIGVFKDQQGPGAFVRAQPTGTTFFIRRGARCFNGEVLRIEADEGDMSATRVMFREVSYMEVGNKQVPQERVIAKVTTAPSGNR
jgi:hypothetical protein